jgi:hypothetical protein
MCVADEVASRARGLNDYVRRMEKLHIAGLLSDNDLRRVYAGAYLDFVTYLERSMERLFLGILMGRLVCQIGKPLVAIRSEVVARAVVNGGRNYVDWFPYRLTLDRAEAFLSHGGQPFQGLGKQEQRTFATASIIRNALAHESTHSLRQFRKYLVDGRALPPSQVNPRGYLRGQHAVGQTRLTFHMAEAVYAMRQLCR